MSTDNEDQDLTIDAEGGEDSVETQRSALRCYLNELANDIGFEMRSAGLTFPLGVTVPHSGPALLSMVTPVDPTDDDWAQATKIICQIVAQRLGGIGLRSRPLPCAIANGTMTVAEITPNAFAFDTRL